MGYIVDFEMPALPVVLSGKRQARSLIVELTPLVPRAVAEAVHEEASVWLGVALPASWISQLAHKADTVAVRNPNFRRLLKQQGNAGRDWLWAFMRHWLSALLHKHSRHLHSRLPSSYSTGQPLPPTR